MALLLQFLIIMTLKSIMLSNTEHRSGKTVVSETGRGTAKTNNARARYRARNRKRTPRLSSGVRWPDRFDDIEVFDFAKKWHLVKPFLHRPEIEMLLKVVMHDVALQRRREVYDPARGPWRYSDCDYWSHRANELGNAAIERGEFRWQVDLADDEQPSDAEWERYNKFEAQFFPQPDTFQWYQAWGASHRLAFWLEELGRLAFPELDWKILECPRHSVACGIDKDRKIKILFDILMFQEMSAKEILEFASLPPRRRTVKPRCRRRTRA